MLSGAAIEVPASAVAEARGYLRVDGTSEDAAIERLLQAAAELCEGFTGQAVLERDFVEEMLVTGGWQRLAATPVRAVTAVESAGVALPPEEYAIDIDVGGDGWMRVGAAARVAVRFRAGLAVDWAGLPEAVRHGIVRLAAHLYGAREGDAGPPAAVTALWRPYRRMRLR